MLIKVKILVMVFIRYYSLEKCCLQPSSHYTQSSEIANCSQFSLAVNQPAQGQNFLVLSASFQPLIFTRAFLACQGIRELLMTAITVRWRHGMFTAAQKINTVLGCLKREGLKTTSGMTAITKWLGSRSATNAKKILPTLIQVYPGRSVSIDQWFAHGLLVQENTQRQLKLPAVQLAGSFSPPAGPE